MNSTFSPDFKEESRYSFRRWEEAIKVPVTTLDTLIKTHGTPSFVKIDVEGYELPVIEGLHSPVPYMTYEFHEEFLEDTRKAAMHLATLSDIEFNLCLEFGGKFILDDWVDIDTLFNEIEERHYDNIKGDIIVHMI